MTFKSGSTDEYVLFKRSIPIFRPQHVQPEHRSIGEEVQGYLLLDFELDQKLGFGSFAIAPTKDVYLPVPYRAFLAGVYMPRWVNQSEALQFNVSLSALVSFATGRPVKAAQNDNRVEPRDDNDWRKLMLKVNMSHAHQPSDLTETDIRRILESAYDHRSKFTHKGKPPPHNDPYGLPEYFEWDELGGAAVADI